MAEDGSRVLSLVSFALSVRPDGPRLSRDRTPAAGFGDDGTQENTERRQDDERSDLDVAHTGA